MIGINSERHMNDKAPSQTNATDLEQRGAGWRAGGDRQGLEADRRVDVVA